MQAEKKGNAGVVARSLLLTLAMLLVGGCYVPLRSPATPASCLPDRYRSPTRGYAVEQNLSSLVVAKPSDYLLGPEDTLRVTVRGLNDVGETLPIEVEVMADGTVTLPLVGAVAVNGMNVAQAQTTIEEAYKQGFLVNPRVSVSIGRKSTFDVTILGEVETPGVYELAKYENDIANVIGQAGGLTDFAGNVVKVHRRVPLSPEELQEDLVSDDSSANQRWFDIVLNIPLREGVPTMFIHGQGFGDEYLSPTDISLRPRDVVTVARKRDPVFFVVGPLSDVNAVNFTVSDRDRQLGNAFILPDDRDIDVVTAVAMAGYIDPIESPSTVTVHRSIPGRSPMLIRVDLIAARYSWKENVYVQPGDIIYLNPDAKWYWRRTFDRIIPDLLVVPYAEAMSRWINPNGFN